MARARALMLAVFAVSVAACLTTTTGQGLLGEKGKPPPGVVVYCDYCALGCDAGVPEAPPDAGQLPDAGVPDAGIPDAGVDDGRLHTAGNGIYTEDGTRWQGRGANLLDTRSCNACAYEPPNVGEVKRRVDELVRWGATFIRLDLESYAALSGRVHGLPFTVDAAYLADIVEIVRYIETKPGVYVLVSLWVDPTIGAEGRPTNATADAWRVLAHALRDEPRAFFGIVNEPENNYDGSGDQAVWQAMNAVVQAIRTQEAADGVPPHLVAVQGTGGWARLLRYYIAHPIPGPNVIYETHVYNPEADFESLVRVPAETLPVIIGEFAPVTGFMTSADAAALIVLADELRIPWAAWTFHMRCSPNLLVENSGGGCGVGMALQPTPWGSQVKAALGAARRP